MKFFIKNLKPILVWKENSSHYYIIFGATLVLIVFSFMRQRNLTNTRSRMITVERLVEKGTFIHRSDADSTPFKLSIDAIEVNGNIYSSKPPNYPLLMAAESWLIFQLSGNHFYPHFKSYLRILTFLNQVFPYTITLLIVLLFAKDFTADKWTINYLLLAFSIGSLAFGYAVAINNHTVSALLFFISFYLTYLVIYKQYQSALLYFSIGFLSGFAASIDLPGLAFSVFFIFLLMRRHWKLSFWSILGLAIPLITSAAIFYSISGSIKPFYLQGHLYHYSGSYWNNPGGLNSLDESKWAYLFNITLGHHGLFSITPVLILTLISFINTTIRKQQFLKKLTWGIMFCSLAVFSFVMVKTDNYGGYCIGLRWFILFMPMWVFLALPTIMTWRKKLAGRITLSSLLLFSLPAVAQALYWDPYVRGWFELWYFNISGLGNIYPTI